MESTFGVVSTLLAAVIGGLIAGFFAIRAANRSHELAIAAKTKAGREIAEGVRTMLSLEIDQNYAAFEKFDAGINEAVIFQGGHYQPKERAQELSDTPLPDWTHTYWEQFTDSIPMALSSEEIKKCHDFHLQLKELERLKDISRNPHSPWHAQMEQSIKKLKELKNPLTSVTGEREA